MGNYFFSKLLELRDKHPSIGDIRGKGLMIGIEFVKNRETKQCFDPKFYGGPINKRENAFYSQVQEEALKRNMFILAHSGNNKGFDDGDMIMIGPYLMINKKEVDEIISILDDIIEVVEKKHNL